VSGVGLQFHLPKAAFPSDTWTFRGANLCAWETDLRPELGNREIIIDPRIGRVVFGIKTAAEATVLEDSLLVTFTYGAEGAVGAHPAALPFPPEGWTGPSVPTTTVKFGQDPLALQHALDNLNTAGSPVLIAIEDSMTHELDLSAVAGSTTENGIVTLNLKYSLAIVATGENRPFIRLKTPLAFRPVDVTAAENLNVYLQGLYITQENATVTPLIARAALGQLQINGCTLDPGSEMQLNGTPGPAIVSTKLDAEFGFAGLTDFQNFNATPQIVINQSIVGPLLMEAAYQLSITNSIVDAGAPPEADATKAFAIGSAADPVIDYGPPLSFQQSTFFGRCRLRSACGAGGIFCHALEAWNNQVGCIQQSSFSLEANRLPQNFACVTGAVANFTDGSWNQPGYAQLALDTDERVLENGPNNDRMGAFGYLLEAHKWRNLQIRLREFMPAGSRPEIIPVT